MQILISIRQLTVNLTKRVSTKASSSARAAKTSSSAERLISIVIAFLAIGFQGRKKISECLGQCLSAQMKDPSTDCVVADQKLQVTDWEKLVAFEKFWL